MKVQKTTLFFCNHINVTLCVWADLASGVCSHRSATMQSSSHCRGAAPWHRDASYVRGPDPWSTEACLPGRRRWSQDQRMRLAAGREESRKREVSNKYTFSTTINTNNYEKEAQGSIEFCMESLESLVRICQAAVRLIKKQLNHTYREEWDHLML